VFGCARIRFFSSCFCVYHTWWDMCERGYYIPASISDMLPPACCDCTLQFLGTRTQKWCSGSLPAMSASTDNTLVCIYEVYMPHGMQPTQTSAPVSGNSSYPQTGRIVLLNQAGGSTGVSRFLYPAPLHLHALIAPCHLWVRVPTHQALLSSPDT